MPIMKILFEGDPVLRRKCRPVSKVDNKIRGILEDMLQTMYKANGVGLAAPQVGISKRMIVIDVGQGPIKVVNPKITYLSDEEELGVEGCLSCPGLEGEVWRCSSVRLSGLDEFGAKVAYEGEGLFARCAQHECDHLDGRLYIDIAENVRPVTREEEAGQEASDPGNPEAEGERETKAEEGAAVQSAQAGTEAAADNKSEAAAEAAAE